MLNGGNHPHYMTCFLVLNVSRSPPINVEDIGTVYFRLRIPNHGESEVGLVRADVRIDGSTISVSFSNSQEWPFSIENDSGYSVKLCQQVNDIFIDRLTRS